MVLLLLSWSSSSPSAVLDPVFFCRAFLMASFVGWGTLCMCVCLRARATWEAKFYQAKALVQECYRRGFLMCVMQILEYMLDTELCLRLLVGFFLMI